MIGTMSLLPAVVVGANRFHLPTGASGAIIVTAMSQ
jgi:hypothetical protein